MSLILKLFLAHLIGDFVLQPDSWVEDKNRNKIKSLKLYLHIGIHFIALLILTYDILPLFTIAIITISHFLIDLWKLCAQTENKH